MVCIFCVTRHTHARAAKSRRQREEISRDQDQEGERREEREREREREGERRREKDGFRGNLLDDALPMVKLLTYTRCKLSSPGIFSAPLLQE